MRKELIKIKTCVRKNMSTIGAQIGEQVQSDKVTERKCSKIELRNFEQKDKRSILFIPLEFKLVNI